MEPRFGGPTKKKAWQILATEKTAEVRAQPINVGTYWLATCKEVPGLCRVDSKELTENDERRGICKRSICGARPKNHTEGHGSCVWVKCLPSSLCRMFGNVVPLDVISFIRHVTTQDPSHPVKPAILQSKMSCDGGPSVNTMREPVPLIPPGFRANRSEALPSYRNARDAAIQWGQFFSGRCLNMFFASCMWMLQHLTRHCVLRHLDTI